MQAATGTLASLELFPEHDARVGCVQGGGSSHDLIAVEVAIPISLAIIVTAGALLVVVVVYEVAYNGLCRSELSGIVADLDAQRAAVIVIVLQASAIRRR